MTPGENCTRPRPISCWALCSCWKDKGSIPGIEPNFCTMLGFWPNLRPRKVSICFTQTILLFHSSGYQEGLHVPPRIGVFNGRRKIGSPNVLTFFARELQTWWEVSDTWSFFRLTRGDGNTHSHFAFSKATVGSTLFFKKSSRRLAPIVCNLHACKRESVCFATGAISSLMW